MMFRRRASSKPPIIGPFFIIALIIGAGMFLYQRSLSRRQLANTPPPLVERQRLQGVGPEAAVAPDPAFVQDHATELKFSPEQTEKIERIVRPYVQEKTAFERRLEPARKRFEEFQAQMQKRRHVNLQEIQEHAAEISQLSGEMAALRQRYWLRVQEVLTQAQRKQAEDLWRQSLAKGQQT